MINTEGLRETKDLMLAFLQARGPSLPVHIARDVKVEPLFAAAFLSELYREQKVKMSHLKVGSTSLYYLAGQEQQLEGWIQYLNQREQEAYKRIKQDKVVPDSLLPPVLQVAIRAIPDFAQSFMHQHQLYWKYTFISEQEGEHLLQKHTIQQTAQPTPLSTIQPPALSPAPVAHSTQDKLLQAPQQKRKKEQVAKKHKEHTLTLTAPPALKEELPFTKTIRSFLEQHKYTEIQREKEDKRECILFARYTVPSGIQHYCILAKDKKKITNEDIGTAVQLIQQYRMPVILIATSKQDKKIEAQIADWKGLLNFLSLT